MNEFTKKEKLLALELLGHAKQSVSMYAQEYDRSVAVEAVLMLALQMAKDGADLSVLAVLEYPDTPRADK